MFFLLPNAKQAQCAFAHCLFMYGDVTFFTNFEYDLIWIFYEFSRIFPNFFPRVIALTTDYRVHVHPFSLFLTPPPPFAFAT